jgi:hypothetical protein
MEQFYIYLWAISENVKWMFYSIAFLSFVGIIFSPLICAMFSDFDDSPADAIKKAKPAAITFAVIGIFCFFIGNLIPLKQDLALIWAYPYIKQGTEKAINSATSKKLLDVTNAYLDKQLKDLKTEALK